METGFFQDPVLSEKLDIRIDHLLYEHSQRIGGCPAQFRFCLRGIPDEQVDFRRAVIPRIHGYNLFPDGNGKIRIVTGGYDACLLRFGSPEFQLNPYLCKSHAHEFADGGSDPGCDDIIFRLRLLQDPPHCIYLVPGVSPIAPGAEITQEYLVLQTQADLRYPPGDLTRDKGLTPKRRFVVEEDSVGGIQ